MATSTRAVGTKLTFMPDPDALRAFLRSAVPAVLILLVFTFTRLVLLTRLPIFLDEALHILRARHTFPNDVFIAMRANKWLYSFILAFFQPDGPESLWLGRVLSALSSVVTCAGCIALGRMLGSRAAGLLAGITYTVLPFAIFHDRQALVDPMMAAFATLTLVFTVRLARKADFPSALLVTLSLGAAVLTKPTALPYFAIPLAGAILLTETWRMRWRAGLLGALSTGLAFGIVRGVKRLAENEGRVPESIVSISGSNFSDYTGSSLSQLLGTIISELGAYWEVLLTYFGLPLIVLAVFSLGLFVMGERRRSLTFLWVPAIGFAAPLVLADRPTVFLPARYLAITSAPFVVLGAVTATGLLHILARQTQQSGRWLLLASLVSGILLVALPLPHTLALVTHPTQTRLYRWDRWQYVEGEVSGIGFAEAGQYLTEEWEDYREGRIAVVSDKIDQIEVYMGPRAAIYRLTDEFAENPDELGAWLAQGRPVFFVKKGSDEIDGHGAMFERVATFTTAREPISIFQVVGADERLRQSIYRHQFIEADDSRVADAYPALAAHLADDPRPRAALAYPPNQIETLESLLTEEQHLSLYAIGDYWPFDADATADDLFAITDEHATIDMIFLQETLGDPTRSIESWLTSHLFWESEIWFGPLRVVRYQTSGEAIASQAVDAKFGNEILLQQAAVPGASFKRGDNVQVALLWKAIATVDNAYTVFAHVVDPDGALAAQHDGPPAGGLAPTDTWDANSGPTPDRFVITLPGDLPPGTYQVRVGLYDPETSLRLPVSETQMPGGPDYVTLGEFDVRLESE